MRNFLVWFVTLLFVILALVLEKISGVPKTVFSVWFGTAYMIFLTCKRYREKLDVSIVEKTFYLTIGMSIVSIIITFILVLDL